MKPDLHHRTIEALLRHIPALERTLSHTHCPKQRHQLTRSLRQQNKRLERMIEYPFRRDLIRVCRQAGVKGDFL